MASISGSDLSRLYAMSGVARSGTTRSADHSPLAFIKVDGTLRQSVADGKVVKRSLTISEQEGQGSNSALLTGYDFDPTEGQEVVVTLGSVNNGDPIFGGRAARRTVSQQSSSAVIFTALGAVDYVFDANQRLITKRYQSETADAILADLISTFAPQLSAAGIVSGLPTIDEITFTNESFTGALQRIADRIGGYGSIGYIKVDDKPVVRLYVTPTGTNPSELNDAHPTMNDFRFTADLSPVKTRVFVEGNGSTSLGDLVAGDTILPLFDITYFNDGGGIFAAGPQRVTYTGLLAGGGGTVVGPGVSPSSPPTAETVVGSGIEDGTHSYAYTWVTGAGETTASALTAVSLGDVDAPSAAPIVISSGGGGFYTEGGTYRFAYTYAIGQDHSKETTKSPVSSTWVAGPCPYPDVYPTATSNAPNVQWTPPSHPAIDTIGMYRTLDGGSTYYFIEWASLPRPGNYVQYLASDATVSGNPTEPSSNTAAVNEVDLSGIAPGPSGTTSRKVYRTAANLSQLKLLTTIADNTTTTYNDTTADASLGVNVPTSDTSGLDQPVGQVNAGATSLLVSGTSAFSSTGGWAIVGNGSQAIRYTGFSSTALTGVPASGPGAIASVIPYNSPVTAAPCLIGIPSSGDGSIVYAIAKGDPVNFIAQVDDEGAQATLADLMGTGDGIREGYIQDRRLSYTEAVARGTAFLDLRSTAQATVTFTSHDKNTRVGQEIAVDIGSVTETFKIQSVQISDFIAWGSRANDPLFAEPKMFPKYTVTASNQRYTLEDLLRQLKDRTA